MSAVFADVITVEIGSTITKVIAFDMQSSPARIIGRAISLTTVEDIMVGYSKALENLTRESGIAGAREYFALSSAAGGLRMTVHGLTRELTLKASEEATLGAGANLKYLTSGKLSQRHIDKIREVNPNLIMFAGGVDFGEEDIVLENAKLLATLDTETPFVYAGNCALQDDIREIFEKTHHPLAIVPNVYPSFNVMDVGPVREIIQQIFSERLVIANGMDRLREVVKGAIMPVPGACLTACELLAEEIGDLVVLDVGGATTDVHSVVRKPMKGNLDPQIVSLRSVEGDLGLFVSADSVWQNVLGHKGNASHIKPLPQTQDEIAASLELARAVVEKSILRHAGKVIGGMYSSDGVVSVKGRDLRSVRTVIGSGGGLCRLPGAITALEHLREIFHRFKNESLLPSVESDFHMDSLYVFSACGSFSKKYPEQAKQLMLESIKK